MCESSIHVLDLSTSMKIAAGEVIDRPASIIRELIDNALDAYSDWICIELKHGGKNFISVSDNGIGMSEKDLYKSYLNHATSKISNFDDLNNLKTFGFRGEALASIAEISYISIASQTKKSICGTELLVQFGKILNSQPKAMNYGTIVAVTNFFQNVPARLKFLASDHSEYRIVVQEFLKKVLAKPEVTFELIHNEDKKYQLNKTSELFQRIIDVFPDLENILEPFIYEEEGVKVYGFLSHPSWYKSSRSYQYFFVNERSIEWRLFHQQISIAYNNLLPPSKFPAVFCYIDIDARQIDYNVHPQKKEIRFENEKKMADIVRRAIRLGVDRSAVVFSRSQNKPDIEFTISEDFSSENRDFFSKNISEEEKKIPQLLFQKKESENSCFNIIENSVYIGQIFSTYLIFESNNSLYLIDFHAMHERIRYENILHTRYQKIDSQIIIPMLFEISKAEAEIFEDIQSFLFELGFELHRLNDISFSVEAIPVFLELSQLDTVLRELFSINIQHMIQDTYVWDSICKMIACKGSVRSGDKLSISEVQKLLEEWKNCEYPHSCPHGRPVMISINRDYFDKEFKRKGF